MKRCENSVKKAGAARRCLNCVGKAKGMPSATQQERVNIAFREVYHIDYRYVLSGVVCALDP